MAVAPKRRPAGEAAGVRVSTVESLESRQFFSAGHPAAPIWPGLEWVRPIQREAVPVPSAIRPAVSHADEGFAYGVRIESLRAPIAFVPRYSGHGIENEQTTQFGSASGGQEGDATRAHIAEENATIAPSPVSDEVRLAYRADDRGAEQLVVRQPVVLERLVVEWVAQDVAPTAPAISAARVTTIATSRVPVGPPPLSDAPRAPAQAEPQARQIASSPARQSTSTPSGEMPSDGAVVAATPVASAAAIAARTAGEVLSGGAGAASAIAAAVEGTTGIDRTSQAVLLGTAQGFFSVAFGTLAPSATPEQLEGMAVPAANSIAAAASSGTVAGAAAAVAVTARTQAVQGAVHAAVGQLLPARFFHISHIDALASFDDAMAAFVGESASLPKMIEQRRLRAWIVTAFVLTADASLLVYWQQTRSKKQNSPGRRCRATGDRLGHAVPAYASSHLRPL